MGKDREEREVNRPGYLGTLSTGNDSEAVKICPKYHNQRRFDDLPTIATLILSPAPNFDIPLNNLYIQSIHRR